MSLILPKLVEIVELSIGSWDQVKYSNVLPAKWYLIVTSMQPETFYFVSLQITTKRVGSIL
jgi:hypothetical protein